MRENNEVQDIKVTERVLSKNVHFQVELPKATILYNLEKFNFHKVTLILFLQDEDLSNPKWDLLKNLSLVCEATKVPLCSSTVRFTTEIWVSVKTFQDLKIQLGGEQGPSPFEDYLLFGTENPFISLEHEDYGSIEIKPKFPSNLGEQ